jgi:hypothetical protein
MSNFITTIKDKQRQREVLIQASLKEQGDERRTASNTRYIYKEAKPVGGTERFLPKSVQNIIDKAKKKKIFRGKGKNDIESLIKDGQKSKIDSDLTEKVYGKNPVQYIKNQTLTATPAAQSKSQNECADEQYYKNEEKEELDNFLDDMFGGFEPSPKVQ